MFAYSYAFVDEPFEDVEPAVLRMLPGLRGWTQDAVRDGERLRARVGTPSMSKTVLIDVGDPVRTGAETWIPVSWRATGPAGLFPTMEAEIVVAPVADRLTQIAFRGNYTVPFGLVGRALDRAALHRVAEASVKSLVDRLAEAVRAAKEGAR